MSCVNETINDTTIFYVSSKEFEAISPKSFYVSTANLKTLKDGYDSIVNHYSKFVYNPTNCTKTVTETIHLSVTDTLVIKATLTGIVAPNNTNTLKVYPNPAKDHITINYGDYATMSGYTLKVVNSLGQTVFTTSINQQSSFIDLNGWSGKGLYYIHLIDTQNKTIDIKQIVIQ